MGLVLDTSPLIELEHALAAGRVQELSSEDDVVLPAAAWAEELVGIRIADSPIRASRRRASLEAIRLRTGVVPFTAEVAEH